MTLLEDTNEQFAKAIRSENYYSALKLDEDFHQIIVDTANNSYIQSMLSSLQPHVSRLFFYNSIILTEKSIAEHADIIELMKSGEGAKASSIMKNNWLRAIEEFRTSKT